MYLFVPFKLDTASSYWQIKRNFKIQIHVLILHPLEIQITLDIKMNIGWLLSFMDDTLRLQGIKPLGMSPRESALLGLESYFVVLTENLNLVIRNLIRF